MSHQSLATCRSSILSLWRIFGASKKVFALSVASGALAAIASAWLLTLVTRPLEEEGSNKLQGVAGPFFALCVLELVSSGASLVLLARLAQENLFSLCLWMSRSIVTAPLPKLQALGVHRLMSALAADVESVVVAQETLPVIFIEGAKVTAVFAYLGALSPQLFLIVAIFVAVSLIALQRPQKWAWKLFERARQTENAMFKHFRAATEGSKELKMDARRRAAFLDEELRGTAQTLKSQRVKAIGVFVLIERLASTLFYLLIGSVLFVFPQFLSVSSESLTAFALGILFLSGPLILLGGSLAPVGKGVVALRNIEQMGLDLSATPDTGPEPTSPFCASQPKLLELGNVVCRYWDETEECVYQLGPITLRIEAGELLFIVGGNGSGKTTLALLLLGLVPPESGTIRLGGRRVAEGDREAYRQCFSAVFADAYVFDSLLGYKDAAAHARAHELLKLLQLDGKVSIGNGCFSTTNLSRGQRKRLAFLAAYIEDRPFYVFDEWAAEQDPEFRDIFYYNLLPDLKERGKTIIVITHDHQYFDVTDKIVTLNYGRIERSASERSLRSRYAVELSK